MTMSELIRREDVITVLCFCEETKMMLCGDLRKILEKINEIPSAKPERRKGEWIYDTERVWHDGGIHSQYHCSVCGFQIFEGRCNFCPYCGAEMRGDDVSD